mmetsp:Transcript_143140/g.274984  ORF Transcript_143140/g.274984 Transcript_143140/m.274984 type:complete len:315 (-) Transcript_143140:4-948(-)
MKLDPSAILSYLWQSVCGLHFLGSFLVAVALALIAAGMFSCEPAPVYLIQGEFDRDLDAACGWPRPPNECPLNPNRSILQPGAVIVIDDFLNEMEYAALQAVVEEGIVSESNEYEKIEEDILNTSWSSISKLPKEPFLRQVVAQLLGRIHGTALRNIHSLTDMKNGPWAFKGVYFPDYWTVRRYHNKGQGGASAKKMDVHPDTGVYGRCLSSVLFFGDEVKGGTFRTHRCIIGNCRAYGWQYDRNLPTIDPLLVHESNLETLAEVPYKSGRIVFFLAETLHDVTEVVDGNRDVVFMWFACAPPQPPKEGMPQGK